MSAANFIGGGKQSDRAEGDFYPTPPEVTQALMEALLEDNLLVPGSPIWEPCCGDGAISEVLNIYGHDTINTDITRRMDDMSVSNFFDVPYMPAGCNTIITNPPYMPIVNGKKKGVEAFIEHAFFILEGCDKMALLLKTTALSGQARCKIMEAAGLHTLYQFRHRITLHKNGIVVNKGSGMVDFAWFYFEKGHKLPPIIKWISVDN
jgi:hypothetical protein